jgi:hypothetical protein
VTPSLPPPQDLAKATFQGWGQVTTAWLQAAERWWATILEWAYDECSYTGVNQTTAYANVDPSTPLRGDFHRATDQGKAPIPVTCISVVRSTDAALVAGAPPHPNPGGPNAASLLVVTINPSAGVAPGGYCGRVLDDATGAVVADSLFVLVATTP